MKGRKREMSEAGGRMWGKEIRKGREGEIELEIEEMILRKGGGRGGGSDG